MIKAVLDACVLFPAPLRDFLLRLADDFLLLPFWSQRIQDEWSRNLLNKRPDLLPHRIERTRRKMNQAFPKSLVSDYDQIVSTLQLPDLNDRHVLAVAIKTESKYIVTNNLKHFPQDILAKYRVQALPPDDFVMQLIEYDAIQFLKIVANHRSVLKSPPKTPDEYLATLENQGLTKTVAFLREHRNEI